MPIVIDCTELYQNPVRAGIQRVVRELLRHWPYDRFEARIARFDSARGLVPLPERALRILTDEEPGAAAMSRDGLVNAMRSAAKPPRPLPPDPRVFIPEVFYDHARCRFYEERQPAMLAYDFLPWLRPDLVAVRSVANLMPYVRLIRTVSNVAYISERTRRDYETRVARRPAAGPVLPLGADGLAIERQTWRDDRVGYVSLGSLDTRKNQQLIVEAFVRLWEAGHRAPLTLIGRAFEGHRLAWLDTALRFPMFRWLSSATDADVADVMRTARATIYVSENEGFGLPPVESLAIGVPAIAAAACPSVAMERSAGIVRLEHVTVDHLAAAIENLQNDDRAAALWREAARSNPATWRDFALATAEWLNASAKFGFERQATGVPAVVSSVGASGTSAGPAARERLRKQIDALPWHHQIDFGDGLLTPGGGKIDIMKAQADAYFRDGLAGKTFLDIGCWDGFNSIEASRRRARRVLATDHFAWSDQCWGKREAFELARSHLAPSIEVMDIDLPDLSPERVGVFDVVLFAGVFYDLRHPFLALEKLAGLAAQIFIVETHLDARDQDRPMMVFYPGSELANDHTNWWGPNRLCVEAMLRDVGFPRVEFAEHPVYADRGIFHAHRERSSEPVTRA
jgi:tRNA (mo5U34)-methyltransferase